MFHGNFLMMKEDFKIKIELLRRFMSKSKYINKISSRRLNLLKKISYLVQANSEP